MSISEKLTTIAENVPKVYNAGYEKGKAEGGGGDTFYDAFWDDFQRNGVRTDYKDTFDENWTGNSFYPKYDLKPTSTNGEKMFNYFGRYTSEPYFNLKERLEECGVVLDFSGCTTIHGVFEQARITDVGKTDILVTGKTENEEFLNELEKKGVRVLMS